MNNIVHPYLLRLASLLLAIAITDHRAIAQALVDANTLLFLSFDNTLEGAQGEVPVSQSGTSFTSGLSGSAASFPTGSNLTYAATGNINSSIGTIEFLVNPTWNGNDAANHIFLMWGGGGGMVFGKDAANNLRGIFNRFATGGQPEFGTPSFNVSSWQAGQWHGLAYTWNDTTKSLKLYIDGTLTTSTTYSGTLPPIATSTFQIGADGASNYLSGSLDSFRISSTERSASEITQYFQAAVPEPVASLLFASGTLLFGLRRRRRN